MSENIYIRRWSEDDWEVFKAMRLEAVKDHSNVFLDNIDMASQYDDGYWIDTVGDSYNGAIFGLYDGNNVIGLAGVFRYRESKKDSVVFGMSYIRENYRGRGLSKLLYKARIDWASSQNGIKLIIASHREGNKESRASIIKHGFKLIKMEEKTYGDGTSDVSYMYGLKI